MLRIENQRTFNKISIEVEQLRQNSHMIVWVDK